MSIAVNCRCGKAFKVKEHLAGKAIRCPTCKKPLRVPDAPAGKTASAATGQTEKDREQEAILRFEEAQRKKLETAEEEATLRAERNKLIESYDQLAGKAGFEKGKKRQLAGEVARKATIFTKISDAIAIVFGNLLARYIILIVLLSGGVVGTVYLVRFMTTYIQKETDAPAKPKDERLKDLFVKAEQAIAAKNWSAARDALDEIIRLDPTKNMNRDYKALRKKLEDAFMNH